MLIFCPMHGELHTHYKFILEKNITVFIWFNWPGAYVSTDSYSRRLTINLWEEYLCITSRIWYVSWRAGGKLPSRLIAPRKMGKRPVQLLIQSRNQYCSPQQYHIKKHLTQNQSSSCSSGISAPTYKQNPKTIHENFTLRLADKITSPACKHKHNLFLLKLLQKHETAYIYIYIYN